MQEPPGPFVTSLIELKLDTSSSTMFESQKYTQDSTNIPHYQKLLDFINLQAQACEASTAELKRTPQTEECSIEWVATSNKSITLFTASASDPIPSACV